MKVLGILDLLQLRGFDLTVSAKLVRHQDARYDAHAELVDLHRNQDANKEWRACLGAVAGVYLILAKITGDLYVGSASGLDGIWGRWAAYADDGHSGNLLLKKRVTADADYPAAFLYSILQILPKTSARVEVLKWEQRYKEKLGSRARGLGLNT